jgi:hypothetical protein
MLLPIGRRFEEIAMAGHGRRPDPEQAVAFV